MGRMQFVKDFRRRLEQLGPYPSLLVLAIPLVIVEPFKLVAVLVAGDGHFLTGLLSDLRLCGQLGGHGAAVRHSQAKALDAAVVRKVVAVVYCAAPARASLVA
jgi:hypothetical protein